MAGITTPLENHSLPLFSPLLNPSQQSAPNCALNCVGEASLPLPESPTPTHFNPCLGATQSKNPPNTKNHPHNPSQNPMAKELAKQKAAAHFSQLHFTLHFSLSLHKFSPTRVYCTAKMGTHSEKERKQIGSKVSRD